MVFIFFLTLSPSLLSLALFIFSSLQHLLGFLHSLSVPSFMCPLSFCFLVVLVSHCLSCFFFSFLPPPPSYYLCVLLTDLACDVQTRIYTYIYSFMKCVSSYIYMRTSAHVCYCPCGFCSVCVCANVKCW